MIQTSALPASFQVDVHHTTSTIQERQSFIVQTLQQLRGKGVIYTSQRQDAIAVAQWLEERGETCCLFHPERGEDPDLFLQAALEKTPPVRFIFSSQPLLSRSSLQPKIDFVVQVGLPRTLAELLHEISAIAPNPALSSCMIVSDADYFVQKFLIDRHFPDLPTMRCVYQVLKDLFGDSGAQAEDAVLQHLEVALSKNPDDIRDSLRTLEREGVLQRINTSDVNHLTMCLEGRSEHRFWQEYPTKKAAQLAELDKVRAFIQAGSNREKMLKAYLQSATWG